MLKISAEDAAVFEAMQAESDGLKNATTQFLEVSQAKHVDLAQRAKAHWKAVMDKHGIEGAWHYIDGKLVPVQQPGQPGEQANLPMDVN